MFKVKYDCNIEKSMMAWAKKCIGGYSPWENRTELGENIWWIPLLNYNKTAAAINATTHWFKELERIGVPVDNVFTNNVFNSGVTSYTQVVWQRSDRIGCAVKSCSNSSKTFVGCQYKESGNWINEKIYETGSKPCTKNTDCKCKKCKCNAREALCIRPDSTPMPGKWKWPYRG
ncbi:C-type single domain activation associated secreted protein ASP3 [Trichostrongylus colubriformis]|uniref:C-type single domain activation associated secreted protein ASP3 n=1 Tax=Trichostrongylus colubriformis TaxID=6319 RepID=A0AAN8EZJ7_TRICO